MREIVINVKESKYICLVDDEDYDWLCSTGTIYLSQERYVLIYIKNSPSGQADRMHRMVYSKYNHLEDTDYIDHINGNPLDNRKNNLRKCTHQQNMFNRRKAIRLNTKSQYKGVKKNERLWAARIKFEKRDIYIGNFIAEKDAALAYDIYARQYFGEFAKTNFADISPEDSQRIKLLIESSQNNKRAKASSPYFGVSKNGHRYYVSINFEGKKFKLGSFSNEEEAARAFDVKAREFYGPSAKTNFPL